MRKRLAAAMATAMLATTAFGGMPVSAAEPQEIVIWTFVQTHADYFEWVTSEYEKEHPEVTFTIEVMENVALQDRMIVVNSSGGEESPDLVDIEQNAFSRYMTEETMMFQPLNELMERDGILDKIVEARLQLYSWNDNYYGLEHALCPVTMAYRQDLFEEYGIEVPTTWEEYKSAAAAFAEHGIYMGGVRDMSIEMPNELRCLLIASGEDYIGADGEVNISDAFKAVTEDYRDLQNDGMFYTYETDEEMWAMMAEDKIATYFAADWAAGWLRDNVPEQSGKWRMAAYPKYTEDSSAVGVSGGTGLCMCKYSDVDQETLWDFMKFAMVNKDNCVKRYQMVSLYPPVYEAMEECNTPIEYYGDQNLGELWQSLSEEIPAQRQADWKTTFMETFSMYAYDYMEGNIDTDEFCALITEAVDDFNASK